MHRSTLPFRFEAACGVVATALFLLAAASLAAESPSADRSRPSADRSHLEADWTRQAELRERDEPRTSGVTPEDDARGGVDGIVNGAWGFHTDFEREPWWQVDLGRPSSIGRVILYNRTEFADRAAHIRILVSQDGREFEEVHRHDGTVFLGQSDGKPLVVDLGGVSARCLRLALPGTSYFHLDEVQVHSPEGGENIALEKDTTQSSTSPWSVAHTTAGGTPWSNRIDRVVERGLRLARELQERKIAVETETAALAEIRRRSSESPSGGSEAEAKSLYFEAREIIRGLLLRDPAIDFRDIVFVKRAPSILPHMSDQFYGWWSRPGGGVCVAKDIRDPEPRVTCLTSDWPAGSYLGPELSWNAERVLFSYARHYPEVAGGQKSRKELLPEDAFYHVFEMNLDGTGIRQLTRGRYDDFDARYLPQGGLVFLSTRKGQALRSGLASAMATLTSTLPDSFVRCGGDDTRPVSVFTLHTLDTEGKVLRAISAFENFEWNPTVAADGTILYARWDYIDRFNGHFMSLWSTNPDGTCPQLVYGNYTPNPQCIFEARPIPGTRKIVFTAAAHHSITGGSVAILDRARGTEGPAPLQRITPEVVFPESEGWPQHYYSSPYPLSEDLFLVSWSDRALPPHAGSGRVEDSRNPPNAAGIYLLDARGNLELIHRDPDISSYNPVPIVPRSPPPSPASRVVEGTDEGSFLLFDVRRGLQGVAEGEVARIRIVGVPPKVQPHMDSPSLGVSKEDPGKFVLGTAPVESDGSAHFRVPAGVPVFFQILDKDGLALRTMRTLTYVQPGQTLACIGCHEPRDTAPPAAGARSTVPRAARRPPSKLRPGPEGTWPLRFDRLVEPVLAARCVACHSPLRDGGPAAALDLSRDRAFEALLSYADGDLRKLAFERDRSLTGDCPSRESRLLPAIAKSKGHADLRLEPEDRERIVTWMDVYAQRLGSFSPAQERELEALRHEMGKLLDER